MNNDLYEIGMVVLVLIVVTVFQAIKKKRRNV